MDIIITDDILLKIAKDSRDIMFSDKYRDEIERLYCNELMHESVEEMFNRLLNDESYLKGFIFTKHFYEIVLYLHAEYLSNCLPYKEVLFENQPEFHKMGYNEFEVEILQNSWLYDECGIENILKDYVDLINNGFRLIREWN
jgi:hypothetical protein